MSEKLYAEYENDLFNLYRDSKLIGSIEFDSINEAVQFFIGSDTYILILNKTKFQLYLDDDIVYNLKINSFWGALKVLELNKTIKGVFGFKWATQLVDDNKKALLKIKHQNSIIDKKKYDLLLLDETTTTIEILLTLFMHLFGSKIKGIISSNMP